MTRDRRTWSPDEPAAAAEPVVAEVKAEDVQAAEPVVPAAAPTILDEAKDPDAKDEPKTEEPEAKEDPKPEVPEAYELKAPEGATLDPAMVELATPVFKELGLTNEQAQKITDLYASNVLPQVANTVAAQTLELLGIGDIGKWGDMAKKDPEFGGANLEANVALAAKARDELATPALRTLLESTRLGNHPEVLKFFAKLGAAIGEGSFHRGDGAQTGPRPMEQILYGEAFHPKG